VLPGAKFANDPTVINDALFVSDTVGHQIYRIEPADFLEVKTEPTVIVSTAELSFSPNGMCPTPDGSMLIVGYDMAGQDQGIYLIDPKGKIKTLAENLGLLDGVCRLADGTLLVTDWKSKSLFRWSPEMGMKPLAKGFAGPADFCVVPEDKGFMVVVPDLVKSELRMMRFKK
jgi:sugar lactone lactonase YvrE